MQEELYVHTQSYFAAKTEFNSYGHPFKKGPCLHKTDRDYFT